MAFLQGANLCLVKEGMGMLEEAVAAGMHRLGLEAQCQGSRGLLPGTACFAFSSCCTPRTKVQRLPQD